MGKDIEVVTLSPCHEASEDLKPIQVEEASRVNPIPSTSCSDESKQQGSKAVIVMTNGKQFDSRRFSNIFSSSSTTFVGEDGSVVPEDNSDPALGDDSDAVLNALRSDERQTTYSNLNLPLQINTSDTLVLGDADQKTYEDVIASNNDAFVLELGDDLPNESIASKQEERSNWAYINQLFGKPSYIRPKDERPRCLECPGNGTSSGSKGCQTDSGGGSSSYQGSTVAGYSLSAFGSSLVTGLGDMGGGGGGGGGDDPWRNRPYDLPRSHYDEYICFDDDEFPAPNRHATLTASPIELPMDTTAFINRLDSQTMLYDESLEMVASTPSPVCTPMTPAEESSSEIGTAFDLIRLMNRPQSSTLSPTTQPKVPKLGLVSPSNPVPRSQMVSSATSTSPQPTSVHSSTSSHRPPVTPTTAGNLFKSNSYIQGEERICELSISQDAPLETRFMHQRALFHCVNYVMKLKQCLEQSCDLKVANDVRAKLASFTFELEQKKLVFSIPKDCIPAEQWLKDGHDTVDLRERLLILQQVVNTLAAIHIGGHEDFLSLYGAFLVLIGPDKKVHLLIDFPVLLQKQWACASSVLEMNPRNEDMGIIQQLYQNLVKPYIGLNSSWASPGIGQVLGAVEALFSDSSRGSRVAELARIIGEKRVCKIELEIVTLPVIVYCIEHELLESALQPLQTMVPFMISRIWVVCWAPTGERVKCSDMATADSDIIRLRIDDVAHAQDDNGLYFYSDLPF